MDTLDIRLKWYTDGTGTVTFDRPPLGDSITAPLAFDRPLEALIPNADNSAQVAEVGQALYRALFPGRLEETLQQNLARSHERGRLRIQLDMVSPALANLPWETLWKPGDNAPLVLHPANSITRYMDISNLSRTEHLADTLHWLFVGASPTDPQLPPLDIESEVRTMHDAFAQLEDRRAIHFAAVEHATPAVLHRELVRHQPHVLYLTAHGVMTFDGLPALAFEDDFGDRLDVASDALLTLFGQETIRLVVLNACQTGKSWSSLIYGLAGQAIEAGVPLVIAMQINIGEREAQAFCAGMVDALAQGETVDKAVFYGRRAVRSVLGSAEWFVPMLFARGSQDLCRLVKSSVAEKNTLPPGRNISMGPGSTYIEEINSAVFNTVFEPREKD